MGYGACLNQLVRHWQCGSLDSVTCQNQEKKRNYRMNMTAWSQ